MVSCATDFYHFEILCYGRSFLFPAPAKAGFTSGQIAYIWITATLNAVYFGDHLEKS